MQLAPVRAVEFLDHVVERRAGLWRVESRPRLRVALGVDGRGGEVRRFGECGEWGHRPRDHAAGRSDDGVEMMMLLLAVQDDRASEFLDAIDVVLVSVQGEERQVYRQQRVWILKFLAESFGSLAPVNLGGTFGDAYGAAVDQFDELGAFAERLDFSLFDRSFPG